MIISAEEGLAKPDERFFHPRKKEISGFILDISTILMIIIGNRYPMALTEESKLSGSDRDAGA